MYWICLLVVFETNARIHINLKSKGKFWDQFAPFMKFILLRQPFVQIGKVLLLFSLVKVEGKVEHLLPFSVILFHFNSNF